MDFNILGSNLSPSDYGYGLLIVASHLRLRVLICPLAKSLYLSQVFKYPISL
jgi:hypothetical protein